MKTESFGVMCKSEGEVCHVLTNSIKATARNRRGVVKLMVFPGVSTQSHTHPEIHVVLPLPSFTTQEPENGLEVVNINGPEGNTSAE